MARRSRATGIEVEGLPEFTGKLKRYALALTDPDELLVASGVAIAEANYARAKRGGGKRNAPRTLRRKRALGQPLKRGQATGDTLESLRKGPGRADEQHPTQGTFKIKGPVLTFGPGYRARFQNKPKDGTPRYRYVRGGKAMKTLAATAARYELNEAIAGRSRRSRALRLV